jgi:hypothetical protein
MSESGFKREVQVENPSVDKGAEPLKSSYLSLYFEGAELHRLSSEISSPLLFALNRFK